MAALLKAPDDLLGRDLLFKRALTIGMAVHTVTIVGLDPEKGVRLAGLGFDGAWVDLVTFHRLLDAGVLESC